MSLNAKKPMVIPGRDWTGEFAAILGIPGKVESLTLHFPAEGVLTATAEVILDADQAGRVESAIRRYHMTAIDPDPAA